MPAREVPLALVVEDDEPVRLLVARMLRDSSFDVIEAGNGLQALEKLERHPEIEVMIVDLVMPGMDGYELLARTRATRAVPAVAMTANLALSEDQEKRLGGAPLLYKPFTLGSFVSAIRASRFNQPAFSYEIEPQSGVVYMRTAAVPSVEEKIAIVNRIWADPRYRRGFSIVVDRRGYDETPEPADAHAFVHYISAHDVRVEHPSSWAIVADRPSVWRFYRSVEAVAAVYGVTLRAFRDYEEATEWAVAESRAAHP
jgi:CheY-like chemotaxis protein